MKLHELKPAEGSNRKSRRLGRGDSSGRGRASTRGQRGAKSRSGFKRKRGFEGGQTPLYMRLPKRGFNAYNSKEYIPFNIGRIQAIAEQEEITEFSPEMMFEQGWIKKRDKVKVLAKGTLEIAVNITAHAASESAKKAIEDAGGTLNIV